MVIIRGGISPAETISLWISCGLVGIRLESGE
jgi:hypothetical protein